ncbi:sulfotransferase family 2 domain-containing protein [Spiribacter pallidus]|uniref:sulfotransferase family 2 domain-containing protein n=1 Tax=Spiribacter pallidus TaxID=1987936 RepID=UPI00349F6B51
MQRLRNKKVAVFDFAKVNGFCRVARVSKRYGYIFVSVPKSGGNSIRAALIRCESRLLDNGRLPEYSAGLESEYFYRYNMDLRIVPSLIAGVRRGPVVSMVRNPFSRALSAYHEKIVKTYRMLEGDPQVPLEKKGQRIRRLRELNLPLDRKVSFEEFLEALKDMPLEMADQHFAPQSYLIGFGRIRYDFIGHLERYEQDMGRLSSVLFGDSSLWREEVGRSENKNVLNYHGGGSIENIMEQYSARSVDLVREYYAGDFAAFGYSLDLAAAVDAPPPIEVEGVRPRGPLTSLATVSFELAIKNLVLPKLRAVRGG